METETFLHRDLSSFGLSRSDVEALDERTVVVTRWNWDYSLGHRFQRFCVDLLETQPKLRVLICCSHPEVLTNGRGLQKPRKGEVMELKEFSVEDPNRLPFPFFQIERGGGLTFHHPGQFIFYPIVKLSPARLSLSTMIDQIFDFSIDVLESWDLRGAHHEHRLLGLWHGDRKLASMGIAIERLTTFHGMAINIRRNDEMRRALAELNPCGLSLGQYVSVEELTNLPPEPLEDFRKKFLQRIRHEWK